MSTVARGDEPRDPRREALGEVIARFHARMVTVARRILRDDEAARDAIQDACVHALRAIDAFEERASLSTWFHRIVVNTALMRLRRERRAPVASLLGLIPGRQLDTGVESAEATVARGQVRACVRRSIEEMSLAQRTILQLRDLHELDTRETAHRLRVSPAAVKVRLHRARRALRRRIAPVMAASA